MKMKKILNNKIIIIQNFKMMMMKKNTKNQKIKNTYKDHKVPHKTLHKIFLHNFFKKNKNNIKKKVKMKKK